MRVLFVVATSQSEANSLAKEIGHTDATKARKHLEEVKSHPTDPFYAAMYRVYTVPVA